MTHVALVVISSDLAGRLIKGGLNTVPYNEVYVRVGGLGRLVESKDVATGEECTEKSGAGRSLERGVGLPVALFVRTATFGHLVSLLRTRARIMAIMGQSSFRQIPLLLISPELGVRVLTENLQKQLLKVVSRNLNPFQNPALAYKTTIDTTSEQHFQQKMEELLDLNEEGLDDVLTPEERARLAGGFGATDDSVAKLLMEAKDGDNAESGQEGSHQLQDIVNEGLASAVRSGDYHTSRQLLILYSLISTAEQAPADEEKKTEEKQEATKKVAPKDALMIRSVDHRALSTATVRAPPPPPPLDTDRLRSATNSDGLLAVLGAAQILRAMQEGSAKRRTEESIGAIEE